jgi:hypothetical protein
MRITHILKGALGALCMNVVNLFYGPGVVDREFVGF